jgi:hypothetical protein
VFLDLVTIEHESLAAPIRLVSNNEDCVSRGETFSACAFGIDMPDEISDKLPRASIWIANADRAYSEAIRSITTPATLTYEIVLAESPDEVEAGPFVFRVEQVDIDANYIQARLSFEDILNEMIPAERITPSTFPGVFT